MALEDQQVAHIGDSRTLLLDIDGFSGFKTLLDRLWILKYLGIRVLKADVYRTVNGRHAILCCENQIEPWQRILFELMLGDDYRRALYNYQKLLHGTKNFDYLYGYKSKTNVIGETVKVSEEEYRRED